jgi:transposase-like protein
MASVLSDPRFHDEAAAYAWVEARLWPHGPVCPFCGSRDRIGRLKGKSTRVGVHKCYWCRKPFRVTVGTLFEASHIKLHLWLQAITLLSSSKKGISTHQLHRTLGIGLKAAWFLAQRIREAMRSGELAPMGGHGGIVEADETYFGKLETPRRLTRKRSSPPTKGGKVGPGGKRAIVSLVERGGSVRSFHVERGGSARSFHVENADKATVNAIVGRNVAHEARLHTDESRIYSDVRKHVALHESVWHAGGEYVRGDVHTNSAEGYFSVFKRGMKGIYQHCGERHLHRYLAEFDFRHNHRQQLGVSDAMRTEAALLGVVGRRLTYRATD